MDSLVVHLDQYILKGILENNRRVSFNKKTTIIYKGHVPIVAYVLIQGEINLIKLPQKKIIETLTPHDVVGLREIINQKPFPYEVVVSANSTLAYLDKSFLLSHLENFASLS